MLDAAGVVLRVHYKSMKCDVLFSQGSVYVQYLGDVDIFSYMSKKLFLFTTIGGAHQGLGG